MEDEIQVRHVTYDDAALTGRHFFMCRHLGMPGRAVEDLTASHDLDLAFQEQHGLRWLSYFVNSDNGNSFCLAEAPSKEAVETCHVAAHGQMLPFRIVEVEWDAVQAFLGEVGEPATGQPWQSSAVRAFLVAELISFYTLASELDDERALGVIVDFRALVEKAVADSHGSQILSSGDRSIAGFGSAAACVSCALALQAGMDGYNATSPQTPIEFRIGLSAGEPVTQDGGLFGAAVQAAEQAARLGPVGGILASRAIRELCASKPFAFNRYRVDEVKHGAEFEFYEVTSRAGTLPGPAVLSRRHPTGLTSREIDVLRLLALGKSNRQIAEQFVISLNTVQRHVSNILDKTESANRTEAAAFAYRERLV